MVNGMSELNCFIFVLLFKTRYLKIYDCTWYGAPKMEGGSRLQIKPRVRNPEFQVSSWHWGFLTPRVILDFRFALYFLCMRCDAMCLGEGKLKPMFDNPGFLNCAVSKFRFGNPICFWIAAIWKSWLPTSSFEKTLKKTNWPSLRHQN